MQSNARELAQEILKPLWPVVRNMEENEARQKEVERITLRLDAWAQEARLEEAKWWNARKQYASPFSPFEIAERERISSLEQSLAEQPHKGDT